MTPFFVSPQTFFPTRPAPVPSGPPCLLPRNDTEGRKFFFCIHSARNAHKYAQNSYARKKVYYPFVGIFCILRKKMILRITFYIYFAKNFREPKQNEIRSPDLQKNSFLSLAIHHYSYRCARRARGVSYCGLYTAR